MLAKPMSAPNFHFRVLVEETGEGTVRATCLDWDIVAEANTPEEALKELYSLMNTQWEFACEHGAQSSVWHPSPIELWKKYDEAVKRKNPLPPSFVKMPEKFSDVVYAS